MQMKKKLGVPENRPLADFLPTITIKAKDLAAEITNFNVKKNDLRGENSITGEHVKNNKDVRDLLAKSSIRPENLPPEEDIKKPERRVKADGKKLLTHTKGLKRLKLNNPNRWKRALAAEESNGIWQNLKKRASSAASGRFKLESS